MFIASTARHSAWCIGLSEAQRQAIYADPRWRGGAYEPADPPEAGLAAARMMAMLSYRSQPSFEQRFARRPQTEDVYAVESYLRYQGQLLVDRFDPATYVTLTRAMDTHDVSRARGDFDEVLRSIRQPTLVVSIDSDVLYWPWEQREVAALAPNARLAVLDSPHGHDAFLIDVDRLSDMVAEFRGERRRREPARRDGRRAHRPGLRGARRLAVRAGKGKVGAELLEQLRAQETELELDYETVLRVVGIADRRGAARRRGWPRSRHGGASCSPPRPRSARSTPRARRRSSTGSPRLPRPILVDLTAADGMEDVYEQAFRRGIDVVAANKRPLAAPPRRREQLREARRHHGRQYRYDTAVGASLPVIGTLRRLVRSGDRVRLHRRLALRDARVPLHGARAAACRCRSRCAGRWGSGTPRRIRATTSPGATRPARRSSSPARLGAQLALEDVEVEPLVPAGSARRPARAEALIAALRAQDEALAARGRSGSARRGGCSAISRACRPGRTAA